MNLDSIWSALEESSDLLFGSHAYPAADKVAAYFAANQTDLPLYVVAASAAILGRIAFMVGLRYAFRQFDSYLPVLDLAVALSIVSIKWKRPAWVCLPRR